MIPKNSTFLITGGCGFIGSNLARSLVKLGNKVKIIDNLSSGYMRNIDDIIKQIEFHEGDIRDIKLIDNILCGCDYVLHHAAMASVPESIDKPQECLEINEMGTLNLLRSAEKHKVKRFIFASSAAVYGDLPDLPKRETSPTKPLSPYAISKLSGEMYCRYFFEYFGLETTILRYFNIFGPGQDPNSTYAAAIPKFIERLLNGKSPIIHGDGKQTRDFIYIDDIVKANIAACISPEAPGEVFNISNNSSIDILTLVHILKQTTGTENIANSYGPGRAGDIKHSRAENKLAKAKLGIDPSVDFPGNLKRTVEYFKSIYDN